MKASLLPVLIALATLLPLSLNASEPFAIRLTGEKLGPIEGSGPNGVILGLALEHEIVSPRDAASGLPTGKRQHKPFTITKELDRSTPLLYKALVTNEVIKTAEFRFFRTNAGGVAEGFYTVTLTNATISGIRVWKPSTKDPATGLARYQEYEEVAFTYQKITWTYTDGGVSASDDWQTPAQ